MKTQVPMKVKFRDIIIDSGFVADIIVEDKIIIEVKAVTEIANIHHQQLLTYLKLTGLKLGILVNFNTDFISKSIFRKVRGNLE
ncbi:GxxExxY protein [Chryseobacterium vietnamense]|uniref:GxxExxY protein n=1 Tax=Chryseobacterium vietnamense TaxID=866785 RepID=UPI00286B6C87|nr:GxxExxY protein [Chryseobacterium vietnamense]